MTYTEEEIDIIVAGIRGGHEVHIGCSRAHTTYRGRGGELFWEDFDEGHTQESPLSEESLRATIASNPEEFIEVLRAPVRARLSEALLSKADPLTPLRDLLAHGDGVDRRHLLEAVLAWPAPPSADALHELATIQSGLDIFHFIRQAIGYGTKSEAAGEFGARVFDVITEMAKPRVLRHVRRYRTDFRVMRGDIVGAIEDLEWEYAQLSPDDSDLPYVGRELATLTDRHISEQIVALAEDDAPRLVWADALTERGDPRGEFIVAQCTLARADADDPIHATLEPRASQLLAFHKWDWGAKHGCAFERGFIASIEVRWTTFLEEADAIFGIAPPLRELRFRVASGDYDPDPGRMLDDPRLERIRSLDFADPTFRIDPENVGDILLPFDGVHIPFGSKIVARIHERLPRLESLSLRLARLEGDDYVLLGKRAGLKTLNLANCDVKDENVAALAGLAKLEELDLSGSWINALPGLPSLRRLRVRGCTNDVLAGRALTSLEIENADFAGPLAPSLRRLKLGPGAVPRLTGLAHLWELDLREARFEIEDLPPVLSLRLRGCHIGDSGLAELVAHPMFERLELLDLSTNDLSPEGARILARAPRLPQRLLLAGNLLGDAGARVLAEAPNLTRVVELDLGGNSITDEGARFIALESPNVSQLGSLRLEANPITPDARQECLQRLGYRLV